jgi:cytidylate kinase
LIIAIDGPAGSGKSTIAREVAKQLGMGYLDTGAMYRAVTLLALEAGLLPDRVAEAGSLAERAALRFQPRAGDLTRVFVGEREITDEIRGRLVSQNVSLVSAEPSVRRVLTQRQQEEASRGNVVLEGRDMGTVVVPNAEVKVFLTASIEERVRRRRAQLLAQGVDQPYEQLLVDIEARDAYDSGRALAPLRKADDAVVVDTTGMTVQQVIGAVCGLAQAADDTSGGRSVRRARKWPLSRLVRGPLDDWFYRVAYSLIPPVLRLLFRMQVVGLENIPAEGPVVLACNHRSNLDPFFLGSACPREIHFMAKGELWKFKPLGWVISGLGTFPVNRGEVDRAAVRRAVAVLEGGAVLGLFPEGHRQREKPLGEIRPGVSLFSLRDGVTTIPAVLEGTDRVVRHGLLRFPRITVRFGPGLCRPDAGAPRSERARQAGANLVGALRQLLSTSGASASELERTAR